MHHPMKRPIESGLTAFWLNVEAEACTTSNGHTVLPAARAGCAGWYDHSSSRITHTNQLCEVMKLLFESSWSYLAHVHGCWGRRGLNIYFFFLTEHKVAAHLQDPWRLVCRGCCWRCAQKARPWICSCARPSLVLREGCSFWATWCWGRSKGICGCRGGRPARRLAYCSHTGWAETDFQSCCVKSCWSNSPTGHCTCHKLHLPKACPESPRQRSRGRFVCIPWYFSPRSASWPVVCFHRWHRVRWSPSRCTSPKSCWRSRGKLAVAGLCRRVWSRAGPAPLFLTVWRWAGVAHWRTRRLTGSPLHRFALRENRDTRVADLNDENTDCWIIQFIMLFQDDVLEACQNIFSY